MSKTSGTTGSRRTKARYLTETAALTALLHGVQDGQKFLALLLLTDGLDGLAAGTVMVVMLVMAAIAFRTGQLEPALFAGALAGACVGFLWFNSFPADIFMGDTGSLALGMALGCLAVLTKVEFIVIIIGGLFVAEALSVMIQVFYYKKTKKRIFLMAPLHHHFEKKGWSETKVVVRFWIVSGMLAACGFVLQFASSLAVA